MGKYMKKSKVTNNDTEPTEPISLGVRTRAAKTLALKRLNSSASDSALARDSSCYLELRSRRLEKPPALTEPKQPQRIKESVSKGRVSSGSVSVHVAQSSTGDECLGKSEAFYGENNPDFESRRSTRESTPCNFAEDLEIVVTPGSSTKSMRTATRDCIRDRDYSVPSASELEEFFAYAEQQQQRLFMDKYNFDIVNDVPLTGRYEWVQVTP
ncbi:Cyclin-dependent kinase inhibitor 3 [Hirschfeldia incana]|nr:Cyclin-dependent kinase inhibitor 3 [Hirschfeldia incana]